MHGLAKSLGYGPCASFAHIWRGAAGSSTGGCPALALSLAERMHRHGASMRPSGVRGPSAYPACICLVCHDAWGFQANSGIV